MSLEVTGRIEKILEKQSGVSKSGKDWMKMDFILKTKEEYNNLYCFTLFGEEKVTNFEKYLKEGDNAKVSFNVSTNEYNGKYYTSLNAWKVFKEGGEDNVEVDASSVVEDDGFDF
jgi:hypothetical protein